MEELNALNLKAVIGTPGLVVIRCIDYGPTVKLVSELIVDELQNGTEVNNTKYQKGITVVESTNDRLLSTEVLETLKKHNIEGPFPGDPTFNTPRHQYDNWVLQSDTDIIPKMERIVQHQLDNDVRIATFYCSECFLMPCHKKLKKLVKFALEKELTLVMLFKHDDDESNAKRIFRYAHSVVDTNHSDTFPALWVRIVQSKTTALDSALLPMTNGEFDVYL